MVFSISTQRTILWDQVRYSGNPTEFAWVLPVRAGAVIELSRDEWMAALDRTTRSTVTGPERFCTTTSSGSSTSSSSSGGGFSSSGGSGGGCSPGPSSASEDSYSNYTPSSDTDDPTTSTTKLQGNEDVDVVSQDVIGPYQAVTIHSKDGTGISGWLSDNDFAINDAEKPIIDAYNGEGFDFIALRLRPNVGVRAMRPVRVTSPGADTSMPLRMVTAGVGSHVGLTLFVIGEGRYETANFPTTTINESALTWDGRQSHSNLSELETAAMALNGGRSWVVQASTRAKLDEQYYPYDADRNLYAAYRQTCQNRPPHSVPCDEKELPPPDASVPDPDAGVDDAGADADVDADVDAGPVDAGPACTKIVQGCEGFDDLDAALQGMHRSDVWVTRLRADLPVTALDADLRLRAEKSQIEVSPIHHTDAFSDPKFDPCLSTRGTTPPTASPATVALRRDDGGCSCRTSRMRSNIGTFLVIAVTVLGLGGIAKRRRRRF